MQSFISTADALVITTDYWVSTPFLVHNCTIFLYSLGVGNIDDQCMQYWVTIRQGPRLTLNQQVGRGT